MSLADELFSSLESKGTDNRGNGELKQSKRGPRVQSYLTEQDERRNSSSGGSPQVRRSSQERGRHEETRTAARYSDARGAVNYSRNDYGRQKCDVEHRKNDTNESAPIGREVTGGRRYEHRSGSTSSRQELHHVRDGKHKRDRSEDTGSSRSDLHPSRNYDEYGKQPSKNKNFVEECGKKIHRDEGHRTKDYQRIDNNTQKFGDGSSRHSSKNNSQPERKCGESKSTQNYVGEPGKYKNDNRKTVNKLKVDEITDNVPFKIINYRKLEDIVNGNPMELVVALANRHSGFENRLKEKLSPDFIILIVRALAKLCKADFHENKVGILSQACEADFLNQVSDYLMKLPFETDENRRSRTDDFLLNLLLFYRTTMELLPDKACDTLPNMLETMERAMRCIEACQAKKFPDALNEGLVDLDCRLKVRIGEREIRHRKPVTSDSTPREKAPPDNFREISIYPTPEDILNTDAAFIRSNIVKGAYSGVEHYLDVQFRLLREDFVSPLRDGITDYMSNTLVDGRRKKRINHVRVYRKVHFIAPKVVKDVVGVEVCFDSSNRCSKVRWEHNKQFMFGSLLCFTKDNFVNIFFGTVVERNVEILKKGFLTVEIHQVDELTEGMFHSEFIMAESEVYFEPYLHVLTALQKLEADIFPMRQYIVDVDVRSTPPVYVQCQRDVQYNIDGHTVTVLDDATWPSAKKLHLDDSQYMAFKSALTKEFVVIQGPPGTGKTFIGLKIAEVLLRNSPIWAGNNRPILVVCYTNHALDQFLEGILVHTKDIIRVGGQSKSEVLSEFNLRERRRKNVRNADVTMLMRDIHNNMSHLMRDIKYIQVDLESINSGKGVISLHTLKAGGIPTRHLSNFFTSDGKIDDEIFLEWLEIGIQYSDEPQFLNAGHSESSSGAAESTEIEVPEIEGDPNEGMWQNAFDDPIDFVLDAINIIPHVNFALVLDVLRNDISVLYQKRSELAAAQDPDFRKKCFQLDHEIQEYHKCMNYWQNCIRSSDRCDEETAQRLLLSENLWQLSPNERWLIYSYWVSNLKKRMLCDLRNLEREMRQSTKRYNEVKQVGDLQVMKNALVIGMTTSGAARLQPLLQALKPRIVIVEEAAEITEPHIVVSLTSECQHLILIGDHKQLRPNLASFKLAKDYKFDISLFERMLSNGMNCEILKVQHRMRPEISKLIVPTIYPELHNHESVMKYKSIEGTIKNLYFVTHNNPEDEACNNGTSKDKSEKSEGSGTVASGTSNLQSTFSKPSTSAIINQNKLYEALGNVTAISEIEKCKDKGEAEAVSSILHSTPITPNASASTLQNGPDEVCSSVNIGNKSQKSLSEESNKTEANNPDTLHDISVSERIPDNVQMDQACCDPKDKETEETEKLKSKLLVDKSGEQIDSTRFHSPGEVTSQLEGSSSLKNLKESQKTFKENSLLLSDKGSVDHGSLNDTGMLEEQALLYEEVYAKLENIDVMFLKHRENDSRKDGNTDNCSEMPISAVGTPSSTKNQFKHSTVMEPNSTENQFQHNAVMKPNSTENQFPHNAVMSPNSTENQFQHDSGPKSGLAKSRRNSNNEIIVHGNSSGNSPENWSLCDEDSEQAVQAVTVWAGGTRRKVVKRVKVKSSEIRSHSKMSSEFHSLRQRNLILQCQEMHNLKINFEMQKQEEELKLLHLQQEYWKKKLSSL